MTDAPRKPTTTADDWQRRYVEADTPWDSGLISRELRREIEGESLGPGTAIVSGTALEIGCGSGTNAVYLAQRGFAVTAVDVAPKAVEQAEAKARAAGVAVRFVCGDFARAELAGPFDFVFDRGCYHCVRRAGQLGGYLKALARLTRPGSRLLILAGNADDEQPGGPPKVQAAEILADFEPSARLLRLEAFRFEDAFSAEGPLGWRCSLVRR